MRISRIKIDGYKSLNNFEASFSKEKTVIIGQNASGKSNFLEALVIIFKNLDLGESPEFDFVILYNINNKDIVIKGFGKTNLKNKYAFWEIEKPTNALFDDTPQIIERLFSDQNVRGNIKVNDFRKKKDLYLPKHVFVYYSGLGNSNRLEEILQKPDYDYATSLMKTDGEVVKDRRFFYVRLHHSNFVLLSFYAIDLEDDIKAFLKENLKIENLETILFVLKQPYWKGAKKDGDPKFWGSTGVVSNFLNDLYKIATAPLREYRPHRIDIWREQKEERLFLYISDIQKIKKLVLDRKWDNIQFFNVLESINASDLHRDIRLRIRKNYAGNITFRDLSEGEQQLLTVLGLMRFTRYEESLYLLDEPDTHLNPYWRWKYMDFISKVAVMPTTSQVIMTSHDALTIGSLNKEEVRIFESNIESGRIRTFLPNEDPKGMGVAGILTEIFYLQTTLDKKTQDQLDERRNLESKLYNQKRGLLTLDNREIKDIESRVSKLNAILDELGFSRVTRDPLYQKFQARFDARMNYEKFNEKPLTQDEKEKQIELIDSILKDMLDEEGI